MSTVDTAANSVIEGQIASQKSLSETVNETVKRFLVSTKGTKVTNLYDYFLEEIEPTLLELVMKRVKENQSEAAKILGLSRGTTRKKLKQYFGEKYCGSRDADDADDE